MNYDHKASTHGTKQVRRVWAIEPDPTGGTESEVNRTEPTRAITRQPAARHPATHDNEAFGARNMGCRQGNATDGVRGAPVVPNRLDHRTLASVRQQRLRTGYAKPTRRHLAPCAPYVSMAGRGSWSSDRDHQLRRVLCNADSSVETDRDYNNSVRRLGTTDKGEYRSQSVRLSSMIEARSDETQHYPYQTDY